MQQTVDPLSGEGGETMTYTLDLNPSAGSRQARPTSSGQAAGLTQVLDDGTHIGDMARPDKLPIVFTYVVFMLAMLSIITPQPTLDAL
jgi:hypothetical protein